MTACLTNLKPLRAFTDLSSYFSNGLGSAHQLVNIPPSSSRPKFSSSTDMLFFMVPHNTFLEYWFLCSDTSKPIVHDKMNAEGCMIAVLHSFYVILNVHMSTACMMLH